MAVIAPVNTRRPLPEDPKEFEDAVKRYKRMVRPLLLCCSKLCEAAGVSPLDKEEVDSGADAFAAVLYEENALFSGRTMAMLWVGGVAVPRVIEGVDKYTEKKKKEKLGMLGGVVVPAEPEAKLK